MRCSRGIQAFAAVAIVVASWVALDRFALPNEFHRSAGETLYRAQVVPPPPGTAATAEKVFVRPLAGPNEGSVISVWCPAGGAAVNLAGKSVLVGYSAEAGPSVVLVARDRAFLALAMVLLGVVWLACLGSAWRHLALLLAGAAALGGVLAPCLVAGVAPIWAGAACVVFFVLAGAVLIGRRVKVGLGMLAGSMGALATAALLAGLAVAGGRLTGAYSALLKDLWFSPAGAGMDFRRLLAVGMVVGACGIVLDLAAAVASSIEQVARAQPSLHRRELRAVGLAVGRDVMGTELTTLVFAYAGAHVGALLLPVLGQSVQGHELPALLVFSQEDLAVQVFATLVGTTALILTIPLTAWATSWALGQAGGAVCAEPKAGARLRWWLGAGTFLLAGWLACLWWQGGLFHQYAARPIDPPGSARYLVQAEVTSAAPSAEELALRSGGERMQQVDCRVRSGPCAGQGARVENSISGFPGHDKLLRPSDAVLLQVRTQDRRTQYATVVEFSRGGWMLNFAFILVAVVILVGRWSGVRALAALLASVAVLWPVVALVGTAGWNGLSTFLAVSFPLGVLIFVILIGPGRKAMAAAAGTFAGLAAGAACALAWSSWLGLTGLESDAMAAIRMFTGAARIDFAGLLQASMVLGVLGAAMDVAIAVASAVGQVGRAKPSAGLGELLAAGLTVGRSVLVPMVLVLAFAYVGLNLPVLVLPRMLGDQPVPLLVCNGRIAVELLRILVGGIAVAAAVPATALAAALLMARGERNAPSSSLGEEPRT